MVYFQAGVLAQVPQLTYIHENNNEITITIMVGHGFHSCDGPEWLGLYVNGDSQVVDVSSPLGS